MDEAARKPAKANIPSVDRVLATDAGRACIARFGQSAATGAATGDDLDGREPFSSRSARSATG